MEAYTPIALLKNKLTELKSIPGTAPGLILEYEKAILVLEIIDSGAIESKVSETGTTNVSDSGPAKEPQQESKSYFEKFMEAQKNKNRKLGN
jgi:hypothetical protein